MPAGGMSPWFPGRAVLWPAGRTLAVTHHLRLQSIYPAAAQSLFDGDVYDPFRPGETASCVRGLTGWTMALSLAIDQGAGRGRQGQRLLENGMDGWMDGWMDPFWCLLVLLHPAVHTLDD